MIRYNSKYKIPWDFLVVVLILVSLIVVPYQLAFGRRVTLGTSILIYLIDLVLLVDVYLNFKTTYRKDGIEVKDSGVIKEHYAKTMFPFDLLGSIPIDALFLVTPGVEIKGLSIVLILRLLRLLRIFRLFSIAKRWERQSWSNTGILRVWKFFQIILLLIHWIACGWFLSSYVSGFPADSWVTVNNLVSAEPGSQFIRSLYWAVTTMTTVGYGDITPLRNVEYIFTIMTMMLGASMYAFIIGNIASLVSNIDSARASFRNKIDAISQYLRNRNVPGEVNDQVQSYYEYLWAHHRGIQERELFSDLPDSLKLDVLRHLTKDLLEKVPLFKYASLNLQNILLSALDMQSFGPGSRIANEGESGRAIYFISKGRVSIVSSFSQLDELFLQDGEYFGNLSLILGEKRTASVITDTFCEIFILHLNDFERIKAEFPEFRDILKKMSSEKSEKTSKMVLDGIIL